MNTHMIIFMLVLFLFLFFSVIHFMGKGKLPVKYALLWIFALIISAILIAIPGCLEWFAEFLGFELVSNMVLLLLCIVSLLLCLSLTIMIAEQKKKTTLLVQELSILKSEVHSSDD